MTIERLKPGEIELLVAVTGTIPAISADAATYFFRARGVWPDLKLGDPDPAFALPDGAVDITTCAVGTDYHVWLAGRLKTNPSMDDDDADWTLWRRPGFGAGLEWEVIELPLGVDGSPVGNAGDARRGGLFVGVDGDIPIIIFGPALISQPQLQASSQRLYRYEGEAWNEGWGTRWTESPSVRPLMQGQPAYYERRLYIPSKIRTADDPTVDEYTNVRWTTAFGGSRDITNRVSSLGQPYTGEETIFFVRSLFLDGDAAYFLGAAAEHQVAATMRRWRRGEGWDAGFNFETQNIADDADPSRPVIFGPSPNVLFAAFIPRLPLGPSRSAAEDVGRWLKREHDRELLLPEGQQFRLPDPDGGDPNEIYDCYVAFEPPLKKERKLQRPSTTFFDVDGGPRFLEGQTREETIDAVSVILRVRAANYRDAHERAVTLVNHISENAEGLTVWEDQSTTVGYAPRTEGDSADLSEEARIRARYFAWYLTSGPIPIGQDDHGNHRITATFEARRKRYD